MLFFANSISLPLRRYQQLIAITTTAASIKELDIVCDILLIAVGEKTTEAKSTISFLAVSGLKCIPTGCCIQEFATRIQIAEIFAPIAVSQVDARWNLLLTLFHPKYITAKKVLSIKKAITPSIASGAPKMSPTNQE